MVCPKKIENDSKEELLSAGETAFEEVMPEDDGQGIECGLLCRDKVGCP